MHRSSELQSEGPAGRGRPGRPGLATLAVLAAACPVLGGPLASASAARLPLRCRHANARPTPSNPTVVDAAMVCLIDRTRAAARLPALHANPNLQRVAAGQSLEMVLGDYFGDDSRSGLTPLQRIEDTPYLGDAPGASTAQNIGWATGPEATPAQMLAAWMASPPHRQIILTGEFRDVGVGVAPLAPPALAGGKRGATYTVEFAARRP